MHKSNDSTHNSIRISLQSYNILILIKSPCPVFTWYDCEGNAGWWWRTTYWVFHLCTTVLIGNVVIYCRKFLLEIFSYSGYGVGAVTHLLSGGNWNWFYAVLYTISYRQSDCPCETGPCTEATASLFQHCKYMPYFYGKTIVYLTVLKRRRRLPAGYDLSVKYDQANWLFPN
jgi:hypothetical protein